MRWWRRVKSSVTTGLTWALAWGIAGVIISPLFATKIRAGSTEYLQSAIICGGVSGWYGFLAGLIFSVVIAVAARRRWLADLSVLKFSGWGVAASLVFTIPPTLYMVAQRHDSWRLSDLVVVCGAAVLCAACSVGTLLMAKRGARLERAQNPAALSAAQNTAPTRERAEAARATTAT